MKLHKTVTPKVLEANRKNAEKSTGPKSPEGKRAVHTRQAICKPSSTAHFLKGEMRQLHLSPLPKTAEGSKISAGLCRFVAWLGRSVRLSTTSRNVQ
jgi:hypothetical protein